MLIHAHAHGLTPLEGAANRTQFVLAAHDTGSKLSTGPPSTLAACVAASTGSAKPLWAPAGWACSLQSAAAHQLTQAQLGAQDMAGRPAPQEVSTNSCNMQHGRPSIFSMGFAQDRSRLPSRAED